MGDIMIAYDGVKWQIPIFPCPTIISRIWNYPLIIIHTLITSVVFINKRFNVFVFPLPAGIIYCYLGVIIELRLGVGKVPQVTIEQIVVLDADL